MPNYDYKCLECKNIFTIQKSFSEISENIKEKCPKCKKFNTKRIIKNPITVVFNGDGFTKKVEPDE